MNSFCILLSYYTPVVSSCDNTGCFNKDTRFLSVNKQVVCEISTYFFLFERISYYGFKYGI